MSENLQDRVRAAVRIIAEAPPIGPAPALERSTPPRYVTRRWARWAPAGAALAVLAAVFVAVGVRVDGPPPPAAPGGSVVLPREVAGLSLLTANLTDAPLRQPGILVARQGSWGSTWGSSQVVVIGADGRTYRRVDVAEERGADGADGEWHHAQALLSPDGRQVAVGDERGGATEVPVLDLTTGGRRDYPLGAPMAYRLRAWSADGRKLAMIVADVPDRVADVFQPEEHEQRLAVLDLDTGAVTVVSEVTLHDDWDGNVHFAPDGTLAVTTFTDPYSSWPKPWLTVVAFDRGPAGRIVRTMALPEQWHFGGWTPDGDALLVTGDDPRLGLRAVRVADGADVRPRVDVTGHRFAVLGWRSPTVLLARLDPEGEGPGAIMAVDLATGRQEVAATLAGGLFTRVTGIDAAGQLIGQAGSEAVGPQRGPWPGWARVASALLVTGLGWLLVARIRRRQGRARGAGSAG